MIDNRAQTGSVAPPVIVDETRELTTAQVRIELLRLLQRSDVSAADIITRAREYEAYVLESREAAYPAAAQAAQPAGPADERSRSRRRGQT